MHGEAHGQTHRETPMTRSIGIIMNGVTGRMGLNQHLRRSIHAIIQQGGVRTSDGDPAHHRPRLRRDHHSTAAASATPQS